MSEQEPFRMGVTRLSQYIRLENCERYLRLALRPDEERRLLKRWHLTIQPLTPLLREQGLEFERQVVQQLAPAGEEVIDLKDSDVEATLDWLHKGGKPVVLLQPAVEARIGNCSFRGRADVLRLSRDRKGQLDVLIADVKASRHERMEHRLQVATYARMVEEMAASLGIARGRISGMVLRLQEDGTLPQISLDTPSFDLDTYFSILDRLVLASDSTINRILAQPFDDVPYHLSYKCDGCLFNAICMYDTAERLDLSLVPYLTAVDKKVLREAGIQTLPQLAQLMQLPEQGSGGRALTPLPDQEPLCRRLANQWPVGPKLPLLVQRAQRALQRFDPAASAAGFIHGGGYGTLPSDEDHPNLVKIFFDAQHDYLQDRVYLISALVSGPQGQREVVHCTEGPPTEASEGTLLTTWVLDVVEAMRGVAASSQAPIHLYCYNRYDQKALLEALKRHLERMAALPAFFDLMTQTPALTQPIISFLAEELEERVNLGLVCMPLHDAARALGFDWQDDRYAYYRLFRARMFDNRRDVVRERDGTLSIPKTNGAQDGSGRVTIESASRFNSQIPLEYAYGVWGRLPEDAEDGQNLEPFRQVTLEQLTGFAVHRVRALAHMEGRSRYKARWVPKPEMALPALLGAADSPVSLATSLKDFLFMEHHAALQAKLLTYSLPIERRVQTGLALLLRFRRDDPVRETHQFAIEFTALGLDPVLTMNACRLKEGDWVVVNPADPAPSAGKIKNGRLAIIQAIGPDGITLKLLGATFWGSKFRYPHDNKLTPAVGSLYTLDEMADDLNADKALEALAHAGDNSLYQWLQHNPSERAVTADARAFLARFADVIDTIEGAKGKLTQPQREVVAARLSDPLFLVQGPPGTGKSHTLAWAVLARLAAAAHGGRPCRVAVCCKTHNAVNIVLEAVAKKRQKITGFSVPAAQPLKSARVFKIVTEQPDEPSSHYEYLAVQEQQPAHLEMALGAHLVVVGGTPGGLYSLAKKRAAGGNKVDWAHKTFDLVVIDEASQMSVPEGVLACGFLKPDGQIIVVGDHRQMPPIIAHAWEDEDKRTITDAKPYLSLFEFLIEKGFPRVSLDESFRLHTRIADFLQENIYVHDGIRFFSKRKELLTPPPPVDPFVDVALNPRYPIVVIEHEEKRSQQYNEVELELITPLIETCAHGLQLNGLDGIGVVVPHRAQKALLRTRFPDLAVTDSIDTVERFQGSERDVIIVSATASDPEYVLAEASFLLNLNRLNVALSRPRKKLIVVASQSVIDLLTSDLDIFENAVIWKRLYYQYASELLWAGEKLGIAVRLRGKQA